MQTKSENAPQEQETTDIKAINSIMFIGHLIIGSRVHS